MLYNFGLSICNRNPASSIQLDFGDKDVRVLDNIPLGHYVIPISKIYSSPGWFLISATLLNFNNLGVIRGTY